MSEISFDLTLLENYLNRLSINQSLINNNNNYNNNNNNTNNTNN